MSRVPQVPECPSVFQMPECPSAQVPKCLECPSAQVPFKCPSVWSAQVPFECLKCPSPQVLWVPEWPSALRVPQVSKFLSSLSARVPKCTLSALSTSSAKVCVQVPKFASSAWVPWVPWVPQVFKCPSALRVKVPH